MIIRGHQLDAMSKQVEQGYVEKLLAHLKQEFPEHCAALGDDGTREAIRYGIERARTYGIVSEFDVARYTKLMFALGRDFDTDPMYPWAGRILKDRQVQDASIRTDWLVDAAVRDLRARDQGASRA